MSCKIIFLGLFLLLSILASAALTVFHLEARCQYRVGDSTIRKCEPNIDDICFPAVGFYTEATIGAVHTKTTIFCPWRIQAYLTSLISLGIAGVFFLLFLVLLKSKSRGLRIFSNLLCLVIFGGLLTAIGLMIGDILTGHNDLKETGVTFGYKPATYWVNLGLLGVTALFVVIGNIVVWRRGCRRNDLIGVAKY